MKLFRCIFFLLLIVGLFYPFYSLQAATRAPIKEEPVADRCITILRDNNAEENVNVMLPNGGTLLHYAASKNDIELTRFLLQRGANVNALNCKSQTPIIVATFSFCKNVKAKEMINFLLDVPGINLFCKDDNSGLELIHLLTCVGAIENEEGFDKQLFDKLVSLGGHEMLLRNVNVQFIMINKEPAVVCKDGSILFFRKKR